MIVNEISLVIQNISIRLGSKKTKKLEGEREKIKNPEI